MISAGPTSGCEGGWHRSCEVEIAAPGASSPVVSWPTAYGSYILGAIQPMDRGSARIGVASGCAIELGFQPGSDANTGLFVVYNDVQGLGSEIPSGAGRTLTLKYSYLFDLLR